MDLLLWHRRKNPSLLPIFPWWTCKAERWQYKVANTDKKSLFANTDKKLLIAKTENYVDEKRPNSFDWIVGMRDRLLPKIKDYTSLQPDFPPEDEKDRLEWNLQISITWQFGLQNIWLHHTLQAFRRYDTFEVFTKTCFTQFGGRCLRNCVSDNIVSHAGRYVVD